MSNLVDDLGAGYVREWFNGALIVRDDFIHMIRSYESGHVMTDCASLTDPEDRWHGGSFRKQELGSFKAIAWPKLGYRNLLCGQRGNTASFVTAQRGVMRGLRIESLEWKAVDVANLLSIDMAQQAPSNSLLYQLRQIFRPAFHAYHVGIQQIRAGLWCSFAVNEDIAISLSSRSSSAFCDILFRDKPVGTIAENGDIQLSNKIIKRSSLRRLFSLEVH